MIRLILAAIGILLICVGGKGSTSKLGFLCLLPSIITILIWFVKKAASWVPSPEPDPPFVPQQEDPDEQTALIAKYLKSPITAEIIQTITKENTWLPTQIIIYNHYVEGSKGNNKVLYSFPEHRVKSFDSVIKVYRDQSSLKKTARPQIAMAKAINTLLSNKYQITDHAKETWSEHTNSDGEFYILTTYMSDHVVMVLKDTLPNRTF